jgi:hypothetical protein
VAEVLEEHVPSRDGRDWLQGRSRRPGDRAFVGGVTVARVLGRVLAVVAIVVGAVLIGFNPNRWDPVIVILPRGGHGIHIRDLAGTVLIAFGTTILWRVSRP